MFVKDIIKLACDFTENGELKEFIDKGAWPVEMNVLIESFVNNFNLVNNEICSEYIPLIKKEVFKTKDLKVKFSEFSSMPFNIIAVKDMSGRKVKFKQFQDYIVTIANKIEILYSFLPENLELSNTVDSLIPARVFAYGIAREYFLMQTMFDEADIWDQRFKNSLFTLQNKKHDVVMPRRRWI